MIFDFLIRIFFDKFKLNKIKACCTVLDAEIKTEGPVISDVRLPNEPYTGIPKISEDDFLNSDLMERIARDTNQSNWPLWISKLVENTSSRRILSLTLKGQFQTLRLTHSNKI